MSFSRVVYRNMSEGLFTGTWAPCTTKEMCLLACGWSRRSRTFCPDMSHGILFLLRALTFFGASLFHGVLWALVGGRSSSIPFRVQSWVPLSYHHAHLTCCQHVTTEALTKHNLNCCNKCKYMWIINMKPFLFTNVGIFWMCKRHHEFTPQNRVSPTS